jgi:hypothetical protein
MDEAEPTKAADAADDRREKTAAIANSIETAPAELAWSAATEEQETEAISEKRSPALWLGPVMALLAAAIAVTSALLFYSHRAPAPNAPVPTPSSRSARPSPPLRIPPRAPTNSLPSTVTTTTSTSAVASGPAIGEPCNNWSKIARDPNTGLTIICDGATGSGSPAPHWTTDDLSHVVGVETIGASCANSQPYAMAISPDDYLVACFPADAGVGQLAGPGSTWQIYHP